MPVPKLIETEEYLKQKLLKTVTSQSNPHTKPKKDPNALPVCA